MRLEEAAATLALATEAKLLEYTGTAKAFTGNTPVTWKNALIAAIAKEHDSTIPDFPRTRSSDSNRLKDFSDMLKSCGLHDKSISALGRMAGIKLFPDLLQVSEKILLTSFTSIEKRSVLIGRTNAAAPTVNPPPEGTEEANNINALAIQRIFAARKFGLQLIGMGMPADPRLCTEYVITQALLQRDELEEPNEDDNVIAPKKFDANANFKSWWNTVLPLKNWICNKG